MQKTAITAVLLLAAACGGRTSPSTTSEQAQTTSGAETQHKHGECSCPLAVQDSQVAYEDTPDGAAVVFSTSDPSEVAELQTRVVQHAEHHNTADRQGHMHVPHLTRADDTPNGARLVMIPSNPSDLDALRTHVRDHVEKMQAGKCPMMEDDHGKHHHGHGDHCMHEHGHAGHSMHEHGHGDHCMHEHGANQPHEQGAPAQQQTTSSL